MESDLRTVGVAYASRDACTLPMRKITVTVHANKGGMYVVVE